MWGWQVNEFQFPLTRSYLLIKTQFCFFHLDNLSQLSLVLDTFLISSQWCRPHACWAAGFSWSSLEPRLSREDKFCLEKHYCCHSVYTHFICLVSEASVCKLIMWSLWTKHCSVCKRFNHLQNSTSGPRPDQPLPHSSGEMAGRTVLTEDAAPPVVQNLNRCSRLSSFMNHWPPWLSRSGLIA